MNIDRLTTIAEWLEAGAPFRDGVDGFDMDYWCDPIAECGTACCIGGAAQQFFAPETYDDRFYGDTICNYVNWKASAETLGLSEATAQQLFYPEEFSEYVEYSAITPAWAARCIRKLIEKGEVDWEGTRGEPA